MTTRVEIKNTDHCEIVIVETIDEGAATTSVDEVKPGDTLVAYVHASRKLVVSEKKKESV